jgi:hypothetical protein
MKTLLKVILALSLLPTVSWANSTICKLEENLVLTAIAWDDDTGVAKISMLNNSHEGMITRTTKHDDGNKTNIYIKYDKPYYGDDAVEFIVFPVGKNKFRIIGVSYILKGREKFLNTSMGNYSATCLSM